MIELQKLINELGNIDVDSGYVEEVLLDVIREAGLEQATIAKLRERFAEELKVEPN